MREPSPSTLRESATDLIDFERRRRRAPRIVLRWAFAKLCDQSMRVVDLLLALVLLIVFIPLWSLLMLLTLGRTPRFCCETLLGRDMKPFTRFSLNLPRRGVGGFFRRLHLDAFPVLLAIFSGKMAFVGPRAVAPGEIDARHRVNRRRFEVRPGLVGLWWVRHQGNIDFDPEAVTDAEYVDTRSPRGDLGVLARAGMVMAHSGGEQLPHRHDLQILGIPLHNLTMTEALDNIMALFGGTANAQVAFVNADCANIAYRDKEYLNILQHCRYVLADGIGMKLAGKILRDPIRQNVNGTDLFPLLCERMQGTTHGIYLLGGKPGIVDRVADWVLTQYPDTAVLGKHHGYYSPAEEQDIIADIAHSGATVLLVAFGVPRQEKWLAQHLTSTGVRVGMGVGGLFDFYSGNIARAPAWMREIGMEWFFRFLQEPGRLWKRYFIGNVVFLWRVQMERRRRTTREN